MKPLPARILLTLAIASITGLAFSQGGGKLILPPNPQLQAQFAKARNLEDRAEKLIAEGKLDEAIPLLKQGIAIDQLYPYNLVTHGAYILAHALEKAGRNEEALDAYRNCFAWDSRIGDLSGGNGADGYALLLSKMGKVEEAKAMYYWTVRHFNVAHG